MIYVAEANESMDCCYSQPFHIFGYILISSLLEWYLAYLTLIFLLGTLKGGEICSIDNYPGSSALP